MNEIATNPALLRIEAIETELAVLRRKLKGQGAKERTVTLEGAWSDITVSDEDFTEIREGWQKKFDDIA